ncbi:MAG: helicase RepA family protein [Actinomycetota bacterium]|nr:helicase RepA family protein [Actinomycetota bacterium]
MPTLRAFIDEHLPGADPLPVPHGFAVRCPVCESPHALRLRVFPETPGAALYCSRCTATGQSIAETIGLAEDTFDALLEGITAPASGAHTGPRGEDAGTLASRVLTRSQLADLPSPEPLIEGTINRRTVSFVAGAPGSAKSFLLLSWAAHIATGLPWIGRAVSPGRVLYVVAEGAYGVHDRLTAWEERHDVTIPDDRLDLYPEAVQIVDPAARADLCAHVAANDYDLVVLDTLSRCAVGLSENDQGDMSRFIDACEDVKRSTSRGTVLVAHHSSKGGSDLRGSSVIEGAADTVYTMRREPYGSFTLNRVKHKDGRLNDTHGFLLSGSADSVVLVPEGEDGADLTLYDARTQVWACLWRAFGAGAQTFTRAEARSLAADDDRVLVKRTTVYEHLSNLIDDGAVVQIVNADTVTDRFRLDATAARKMGLPLLAEITRPRARPVLTPEEDPF